MTSNELAEIRIGDGVPVDPEAIDGHVRKTSRHQIVALWLIR